MSTASSFNRPFRASLGSAAHSWDSRTARSKAAVEAMETPRLRWAWRVVVEELERRMLLTSVVSSAIPAQISPTTIPQQLFVAGTSSLGLSTPAGLNVVGEQFYRFALNNAQEGPATVFSTAALAHGVDTALALYDADGNLLQKVDSDQPVTSSEILSAVLPSGKQFELGVFAANISSPIFLAPPQPVTLTAAIPPQVLGSSLKIDPGSGKLQFTANSGNDRFNSQTDVNYYPLDFTNGGTSGTVTLQAPSPDTKFFASLYRQDTAGAAWQQIATGSGAPVTLNVTPPSQSDLTDARYELAVAPLNFNSPAQPYEVDLSAGVLGPASVARQTTGPALAVAPTSPGTAGASASQAFASAALFPFGAVDNGLVTITLQTTTAVPLLSLYEASGTTLLGVAASQVGGGQVSLTIPATKGEQFIARAGDVSGSFGGQLTLTVSQAYAPTPLRATGAVQQQSGLAVAMATGGQLFRLTPPAGANYLVLQLTPDAGGTVAPRITAVASGLGVVQASAAAGNTVVLPIDLSQASGPVDVYLSGDSGSGTATLSYSALTIPQQIPLGQFATQSLDVMTAGLSATLPAPAAGQMSGVQFYELSPGQVQTFTAQASTGSAVLLLRYAQDGGILRLENQTLGAVSAPATMTSALQGTLMYGIAAIPLGVGGSGTIQLQVSSPTVPQGVGVSMAPNQIALPNQPPPTAPFFSQLKLVNQILTSPQQRDLFATLLPFDISASPTLTFTPNTIGGPLAVRISVLDANNNTLNTFTTQPGQAFTSPALTSLTPANAGQTVRLLVEPVAGMGLGDGMYNLEMDVATSDPNPFLATEPSFSFFRSLPPITSIPFGSSVPGTFSTSDPTTQFYSVVLPNATTVQDLDRRSRRHRQHGHEDLSTFRAADLPAGLHVLGI